MSLIKLLDAFNTWAIFSAERIEYTPAENAARTAMLESELHHAGYTFRRIRGTYGGETEASFLVFNIDASTARNWAHTWAQESILTRRGIEYCDCRGYHPTAGIEDATDPDNCSVDEESGVAFVSRVDWDRRLPLPDVTEDEAIAFGIGDV